MAGKGGITLREHMERALVTALKAFPADAGIYAVTFRIDSVDQDPRFPYLAVGYSTEADVARVLAEPNAPDEWEARWSYAYFPPTGLEGVRLLGGHPGADPEGRDLHLEEIRRRGLEFLQGEDDDNEERGERIDRDFHELCVGLARWLHEEGHLARTLGRPLPVIVYDMFDPDGMFEMTRTANPAELVADFLTEDPGAPEDA